MNQVCLIGYFPPPVHGMSLVTVGIKNRLVAMGCMPYIFDLSTQGLNRSVFFRASKLSIVLRGIPALVRWLRCSEKCIVYLALSGGNGQIFDMILLLLVRIFGAQVYIHHHSYQYINRYSFLTKCLFQVAGKKAKHILLGERMAKQLKVRYQSPALNTIVLSNAAFIEPQSERLPMQQNKPLHVGFLSNIAKEKGIDCFIGLIEAAKQQDICIRASIAGPFQDGFTEKRIMERIHQFGEMVRYIGSQYGDDKHQFLDSLDVLLFPTEYNNEAAPLVIYEALSHGVPVISKKRGVIGDMIKEDAGLVLSDNEFEQHTLSQLVQWSHNRADLCYAKKRAFKSFICMQKSAEASSDKVCSDLTGCKI